MGCELENRLNKTFPKESFGEGDSLLSEASQDDSDIKFLYKYRGSNWKDIDSIELGVNWECLFFLNEKGKLFVYPKFLQMLLDDDPSVPEWQSSFGEQCKKTANKSLLFSKEQKELCLEILFKKGHPLGPN